MVWALIGLAFGLTAVVGAAVGGFIMAARWARSDSKALVVAQRERDVVTLEKQTTEAQLQQTARELTKEKAAHREQLASAKEELAHAKDLLRRAGGNKPELVDERLLRVEERLAPRSDPRDHDDARVPGLPAAGDHGPDEGEG